MKLAIVGGRDFNDKSIFDSAMADFHGKVGEVVSGGACGADTMASEYAKLNGIALTVFHPDWAKHGRAAGPIRNKLIIDHSDACVAFWDGVSKGTKSSINHAKKKGIPTHVFSY